MLLTAALVVYLFLLADRAFALFASGTGLGIALGIGVLLLPVLGVWVVVVTWRNGLQIQRLSRRLDAEGALPDVSDLPRRPSGRVDRDAADAWFAERRAEVEADQENWRAWYKLAYAYDIAGDRRRARETMKTAVELEAAERSGTE
nr:hypothetical protein [Amycolatopsis lexingtonensis]